MSKIINCTAVNVAVFSGDEKVLEIPASGFVAKAQVSKKKIGEINGISLYASVYGELILPPEEADTYYICSGLVVNAAAKAGLHRSDLVMPDDSVRNEKGTVIGCCSFAAVRE